MIDEALQKPIDAFMTLGRRKLAILGYSNPDVMLMHINNGTPSDYYQMLIQMSLSNLGIRTPPKSQNLSRNNASIHSSTTILWHSLYQSQA